MRPPAATRLGPVLALAAAACSSSGGASDAGGPPADGPPVAVVQVDTGCGPIQSDPHNCGGCGIDCEGGACVEGVCTSPPLGVLASGRLTPVGIALDDASVYWMELGFPAGAAQVLKCAKTGCSNTPTVLASGQWTGPTRLAVYGGSVYWAAQNLLLSCPTDGCPGGPTVLSSGAALSPTAIAVGPGGIYVGDSNQLALLVFPLAGTPTPTIRWSSAAPTAIALDGTTAYFATAGVSIISCGPGDCVTNLRGGSPTALAVDATNVYIGTQASMSPGIVAFCPEAGCPTGPGVLTNRVGLCAGIASDGTDVYFTDQGTGASGFSGAGRVARCPVTGCAGSPVPVAGFVNFPQQIAIDDKSVYWTDFGSGVLSNGTTDGRVMVASK